MSTWENKTAIESRVGLAVETTEGTAIAEPTVELFMIEGNAPDLRAVWDNTIKMRAFNEPYKRDSIRGYYHAEADTPGLKFCPSNGIPEILEVAFGNEWYSKQVYALEVETGGGATFARGNKLFGKTSLARAEVVRVVSDVLWLTGSQGTFGEGEDLLNKPSGTDYGKNTATIDGAGISHNAVSGYYCHKMDAVRDFNYAYLVKVSTTSAQACVADPMIDFSEYGVSTGNKRVFVTVKDTATPQVPISGWLGAPCMYLAYDGGTAAFTVGAKLSAKTGGGGAVVIGNIISIVGDATSGYLFVEQDATARTILDEDVLSDDNGTPGAAVANMTPIPAYLNNACKVYNNADSSGATQNWNGNTTSFDETDVLTFTAQQRKFDQKSLTMFVKDAGADTRRGIGMKVRELAFDITADKFTFDCSFLGRALDDPTTEPAYPGGITNTSPFGAQTRTFELDGSSSGQATQVNRARFSATFDFSPAKGVVITENNPTNLQPTAYNILGTLDVLWLSDQLLKDFWNNASATAPVTGTQLTKRLFFSLTSSDAVTGTYYKMLQIGVLGTIDTATLNRDQDGYIQPVVIEGIMHDASYVWGPCQFFLFDGTASH